MMGPPFGKSISVLFITMNRHEELVDIIRQVDAVLPDPAEIILVDNASQEEIRRRNREALADVHRLRIIELDHNAGVSGGRNVALKASTGEYVVELDDDAHIEDPQFFQRIIDCFERHPDVGIQAFRIVNFHTRRVTRTEYPFRNKRRDPALSGYCTSFIGCGHAFKRKVLDTIGVYGDFAPWGSEEPDYALRAMDVGFNIYFNGDVVVYHKKSPKARIADPVQFASIALKNRLKVAYRNLPWFSLISYFLVRGPHLAWRFRSWRIPGRALSLLWRERDELRGKRRQIRWATFWRLVRMRGHAFY